MENYKSLILCLLVSVLCSIQSPQAQERITSGVYADGKEVNIAEGFSISSSMPEFIKIESAKYNLDSATGGVTLYLARGVRAYLIENLASYEDFTKFNLREWMKELEGGENFIEAGDRFIIEVLYSKEEDEMAASSDEGNVYCTIMISK
jgi:hypothetical protein